MVYAIVKIEAAIDMRGFIDAEPSVPRYAYVCKMAAGVACATLQYNRQIENVSVDD